VPAMRLGHKGGILSRWRRQQRKRARGARLAERVRRIIDEAVAAVSENLRLQVGRPPLPTNDAIRSAIQSAIDAQEKEDWIVTSEMGDGDRSLKVNVTVKNPSPETARLLLASGGRWV
jgi:transposase-like protein